MTPPPDRIALLREHQQHQQHSHHQERLPPGLRSVLLSTGAGFVYGVMFGSVVAGFEGLRASPAHERLRGALHHMKAEVPRTAGRIALVTCLFRVASLSLTKLRNSFAGDGEEEKEDMLNVLFAAPVAGAALKFRHGPKAALHSAFMFGSIGTVMVVFHSAETQVVKHHHRAASSKVEAREVLEEIAFAEEFE